MKKTTLIICMLLTFFLGACSASEAQAEQTRPLKIWYENTNGYFNTYCVVDDKTGVNYVVVASKRSNTDLSVAITPRLNADGSLYTSK